MSETGNRIVIDLGEHKDEVVRLVCASYRFDPNGEQAKAAGVTAEQFVHDRLVEFLATRSGAAAQAEQAGKIGALAKSSLRPVRPQPPAVPR